MNVSNVHVCAVLINEINAKIDNFPFYLFIDLNAIHTNYCVNQIKTRMQLDQWLVVSIKMWKTVCIKSCHHRLIFERFVANDEKLKKKSFVCMQTKWRRLIWMTWMGPILFNIDDFILYLTVSLSLSLTHTYRTPVCSYVYFFSLSNNTSQQTNKQNTLNRNDVQIPKRIHVNIMTKCTKRVQSCKKMKREWKKNNIKKHFRTFYFRPTWQSNGMKWECWFFYLFCLRV